ncbi:lytic transglycosylase domain-containing protein [Helicobacter turcicus]|uniref:Lytic transglycosylase domain-containing protein n=1 Tax=Helicobacter turcicus TaxID=2867412 RepID=A0ABS7JMF3_9HELI|nr:lytic transglycosylase domain-containing protein [Helicobacter turcicus]MBX7490576.1 lytic transglycosylase domain-containing protein [Helicobacter turcicus]MBX7545514.1 lytic transglycosylase domain-containing protein [Helicobacter turcicus]
MRFFLLLLCALNFAFSAPSQPQTTKQSVQSKPKKPTINQNITLDYLKKQPAGISRDFYIWLFLQQDISPKEAKEAYNLATRKNTKLFGLYFKKGDNKTLSRKTICQRMSLDKLLKEDAKCIALALTTKKAESLDKTTLKKISNNVKSHNSKLSKNLQILASKNPFKTLITQDSKTFASFYFAISQGYRNHLNFKIPQDAIIRLINERNSNFSRALRHMILSPNLKTFNASLTEVKPQSIINALDAETSFYLGLNAMHHDKKDQALSYFLHSQKLSKYSFNKNRATFWAFLASNDALYLQEITRSKAVDVYSLASLEMLKERPNYNIVYDIPTKTKSAEWDFKNPFEWERIRDSFKSLKTSNQDSAKKLLLKTNSAETKAHYVWLSRDFNKEYFLMPYKEVFSNFSNDKQALLYALARQESLFIPTAISTSYALGLMQLMPFNVKAIAKELNQEQEISYLDMFDPAINVPYAEYFTRPLIREFNHPLFISYAYNGGPGFTRRLLAKNYLFKKSNPLDPWYSMEMIPYEESRAYGKKVLANYVIYQRKLGKEVNILDILHKTLIY